MTAELQTWAPDGVLPGDDGRPITSAAPTSTVDSSVVAKLLVGATLVGALASTARAEDRMTRRMPRGFSVRKPNGAPRASLSADAAAGATITPKEAARFLAQTTMGTRRADIGMVQGIGGYASWIADQFMQPYPTMAMSWLFSNKFNVEAYRFDSGPFFQGNWRLMINTTAQLRQRIVFALSNIFVINANSLNMQWPAFAAANFTDLLQYNAFGNFRTLLEKITLSSAMGAYLNMRGNEKADLARKTEPDENYAREVLQLFTIGLFELNQDGTAKLNGGSPIDTYDQRDIAGLARVLTG